MLSEKQFKYRKNKYWKQVFPTLDMLDRGFHLFCIFLDIFFVLLKYMWYYLYALFYTLPFKLKISVLTLILDQLWCLLLFNDLTVFNCGHLECFQGVLLNTILCLWINSGRWNCKIKVYVYFLLHWFVFLT